MERMEQSCSVLVQKAELEPMNGNLKRSRFQLNAGRGKHLNGKNSSTLERMALRDAKCCFSGKMKANGG